MRFVFASVVVVSTAFGFTGLGANSMAESGPLDIQLPSGNFVAEGDTAPDLVLAANGKKKGPKGDVDHGKIVQPNEQADACGAAKRRGPKVRDNEDVGKVAVGDSADVDAKATCPPPKDLPAAVKGRGGPKGGGRDKILTN